MLGRTNVMFVPMDEAAPIQLMQEVILTASTSDIWKIEFVNGVCFAFLDDGKVLYGEDVSSLAILKNGDDPLLATHVAYADGKYYFARSLGPAAVLASVDLAVFHEIKIKDKYHVIGLYKSTAGKIALLVYTLNTTNQSIKDMVMLVADTLEGYQEEGQHFIKVNLSSYSKENIDFFRKSKLLKDRVVVTEYDTQELNNANAVVISLDGTKAEAGAECTGFSHGYFYSNIRASNSSGRLYYSINGVDYRFLKDTEDRGTAKVMEFSDGITGIFFTKDGVYSFAAGETPDKLAAEMDSGAVPVSVMGHILTGTEYEGHTYIGCTGGVILKTYIDYSGSGNTPEVTALKTLSAKQALKQAREYTDEKYRMLEDRIAALETAGV